ncbi:hsdR [Janthinobacterium sp. PC23-8]|uniref:hsdR n=1 Tax=Janthinobacterium sp. PC23-8 TaxID=2012679 RepID=UPI0011408348|nr:hsdR [Janthinobacterium sp. PC23-8]
MSKPSIKKELESDFNNLVRNGIDFLAKAISQLDSDAKHSVINFHTAVEIFLKAPLVHEHWTLVVVDRDANRKNYEAGDFQSVSFSDACTRLDNALNKPLRKSAKEAFDKVRKHRNRMVHFYHSGINGKQRDEIKLEQAQAWFELNRFITDTWREQFKPFENDFRKMERTLIANNHYAKVKYEDLKPKIEGMKVGGAIFEDCPVCTMNALKVEEEVDRLFSSDCMVCFHSEKRVQLECPQCNDSNQHMVAYDGLTCTNCKFELPNEDAFDLLDQNQVRGTKHDFDSDTPANCDECQGFETVCEYQGGYLCTNCLVHFDSVARCQSCGASMTGCAEDTYSTGCEHCDGYAGYRSDD